MDVAGAAGALEYLGLVAEAVSGPVPIVGWVPAKSWRRCSVSCSGGEWDRVCGGAPYLVDRDDKFLELPSLCFQAFYMPSTSSGMYVVVYITRSVLVIPGIIRADRWSQ